MTANGCSARSLSSARRIWGAVDRVILPARVTTRQLSRVACAICIPRLPPGLSFTGACRGAIRPSARLLHSAARSAAAIRWPDRKLPTAAGLPTKACWPPC